MDIILYLKDDVFWVVDQAQRPFEVSQEVDWKNEDELEAFFNSLPKTAKLKLVFDFIDENIQYEWVPKLLPWDKPAYKKRLVSKAHASGGLFVHCQWLPIFQYNGIRNEQLILIASILNSAPLEKLLALIKSHELSVTRLYSHVFLIAYLFFKKLAPKLKIQRKQLKLPFLLVFREQKYRFRQLFFLQGILRISRSVQLDEHLGSEQAIHEQLNHETEVAIKYLYNQKILPMGTPVGFVYLNHLQGDAVSVVELYQQEVADASWNSDQWFAKEGNLTQLLSRAGATEKQVVIQGLSDCIASSPPPAFFHWEYVQKHRLFSQLRFGLNVLWISAMISGFALLIQQTMQTYFLMEEQTVLKQQSNLYLLEKQRLQNTTQLPYDAEDVKATVEFSEAIMQSQAKKGLDLQALSQVVAQHPHILLETLSWQKGRKLDGNQLSVHIQGWVFPFDKTYQSPVQWVDRFVLGLNALPGIVEVKLTQEPLDRNLQKSLEVEGQSVKMVTALPFRVMLRFGAATSANKEG
ncbi:hypothetical protein CYQ88_01075 [Hydrogenovibrio sp. SC-1]|uniref:hypothetical protein n=1 Tax=Hydrogenovibrio sp. SC-1 TaxID=2065820 RepID=UPI000C7C0A38|nr:hypothetical protein [Hydrogenovibrio sp. SC-1]PLA75586.1 hypothetical protein CYQ88_01075 [Hydrogenovibrio sp. SC-1]